MKTISCYVDVYVNGVIIGYVAGIVFQDGELLATVWADEYTKLGNIEAKTMSELFSKAEIMLRDYK